MRYKKKKRNTNTWVGASLAVLAAGAVLSYTQKTWPFNMSNKPAGDQSGSNNSKNTSGQAGQGGAQPQVDVELTNEVAEATQSSPSTEGDFTNEGATGNND
ncbi:hypothetical protein [Hymenobacter wooponensis]|uniref:Uncharacterized protein n=1 Tax=Hymenobacter wooponensis TaxID=1525360 RepID=A0A4Z0MKM8_9BACT|nr:hypothetical protein [Hymenobacter wooponensis]TGD79868.1 hypothetical protein EU557_16790 [Hymenobacter wooponensis]